MMTIGRPDGLPVFEQKYMLQPVGESVVFCGLVPCRIRFPATAGEKDGRDIADEEEQWPDQIEERLAVQVLEGRNIELHFELAEVFRPSSFVTSSRLVSCMAWTS